MNTSKRILSILLLFSLCFTVGCGRTKSSDATGTPGSVTPTPETITAAPGNATQTPAQIPTETATQTPVPTPTKAPDITNKKIIALTFDDGPHQNTQRVLDVLEKHNVKATFFIVGRTLSLEANQAMLVKTFNAGHEIANHSYSHPDLRTLSDADFLAQINQTNDKVKALTGQTPVLFRPPSGYFTQHQLSISPLSFVLWYIDSWDWFRIGASQVKAYATEHQCTEDEAMDQISDQILYQHGFGYGGEPAGPLTQRLAHGSVLLFHDVHAGTAVLVDKLLTYIEQSGEYIVMPVSQMMTTLGTGPIPGKVYRSAWPKN